MKKYIDNLFFMFNMYFNLDPFCPVFKLDYILNKAESDKKERLQMLIKVFEILI